MMQEPPRQSFGPAADDVEFSPRSLAARVLSGMLPSSPKNEARRHDPSKFKRRPTSTFFDVAQGALWASGSSTGMVAKPPVPSPLASDRRSTMSYPKRAATAREHYEPYPKVRLPTTATSAASSLALPSHRHRATPTLLVLGDVDV